MKKPAAKTIEKTVTKMTAQKHKSPKGPVGRPKLPPSRPYSPYGLVLALQFCHKDEDKALALARLLADIEPMHRNDCLLLFCRSCDMGQPSVNTIMTSTYCAQKFPVEHFRATRRAFNYPAGPNEMWASVMEYLCEERAYGRIPFENVFTFEADGTPLRVDWIDRLIEAHRETLSQDKLITGCRMARHYTPHVNGNLVAHFSLWENCPSLHRTPQDVAWDMHHRITLLRNTRASTIIRNEYDSKGWNADVLASAANESAWIHGVRDMSAWQYAQSLVKKPGGKRG